MKGGKIGYMLYDKETTLYLFYICIRKQETVFAVLIKNAICQLFKTRKGDFANYEHGGIGEYTDKCVCVYMRTPVFTELFYMFKNQSSLHCHSSYHGH